jgi:ankyrin repeat protein
MSDDDFFALCLDGEPHEIRAAIAGGANVKALAGVGEGLHWTVLTWTAAHNGNPGAVLALIERGAELDARDEDDATALMRAAYANENPAVIAALIAAGADIGARDGEGMDALMYAAMGNANPEIVLALLDAGADPGARDKKGKRAADYAADNESLRNSAIFQRLKR